MDLQVVLTEDAEQDLEDIYDYISASGSPQNADYVLDRLLEVTENLTTFPERGSQPKELRLLGIKEYRQAFFQALSHNLSSDRRTGGCLHHSRWQA